MKKLLFFLLIIISATPALAEDEIPVNIKADKLKYIEDSSIVTASGSVEVVLERVTIKADSLAIDTKTNIVTAEGNVRMTGLEYGAEAAAVTYTMSNETAAFRGFKSKVSPSNMRGNLYLKADEIDDAKNKMTGKEGKATTCDYANPHYFTAGRRIEYYPEDKIIGYWVTFYIMDVPVFWTPYFYYDLKQKNKRNWTFGHNEVEGNFVKTAWDYKNGQIFLDEMEKKSFGQGLTYNYGKNNYDGVLYLYHIEEADTHISDWVAKLNHNIGLTDKTKLGFAYALSKIYQVPAGRLDQSTYNLSFNHSSDKTLTMNLNALDNRIGNAEHLDFSTRFAKNPYDTSYSINIDQGKNEPRYIRTTQRLSHTQTLLSNKTRLNFNAAYYRNIQFAGEYGDERLEPYVEILHSEANYRIKFYENWRLDLDRDLYRGDESEQYMEAQPEIGLDFNPLDLKIFNLSSSFGYGWYHEIKYAPSINKNRDYATGRYKATLNASKSIPLALGTTLGFGFGLDQFLYDPGDAMNAFREDLGLYSQGYNFFRNDLKYTRGISDGNSPFFFDKFSTRYNNLRDTLTFYHQDKFNWVNTGGYNYDTNKYFNYETGLTLRPVKPVDLNFRSGFDIENQKYLDLSSAVRVRPWEKLSVDLNLVNDMNLGGLKQGNCLLDLETADEKDWGNHWHFKYGYVYDTASQNFLLKDIMIKKDLHCWDVTYTYSDYRKEFTLVFTLKAFPGDPIGYGQGRGFYFDSFEKALKSETNAPSPARY